MLRAGRTSFERHWRVDNCYMAVYTYLGPEQFWHTSRMLNDNDFHLRLIKGTTGSLTVALLIFISTLGWRKQCIYKYADLVDVALGALARGSFCFGTSC